MFFVDIVVVLPFLGYSRCKPCITIILIGIIDVYDSFLHRVYKEEVPNKEEMAA